MSQKNARILCAVCLWVGVISGGLSCPIPALARVLLKPNGQNALPLRTKTLNADVTITGQFATTKTVMTFQNELRGWRPEVEFFYTMPPNTVMTYFAYWFQNEKVVARVVEKERAALIYTTLTRWGVDPALIELVGKNTFRARIFPVFMGDDLKIEMHTVQVLPSDQGGMIYEFPLREQQSALARPGGSWGTYEKLDLNIRIAPDTGLTRILSNYNLPVRQEKGSCRLRLSQINYRPPMDLRVRLARPRATLHTAMYTARASGQDGFFSLALTPNQGLRQPVVKIIGVPTYQIVPTRLPNVKAHQVITVCGRYKGHGSATVTLAGWTPRGRWSASQPVMFSARRENNNLATKLWASSIIEQLSVSESNRNRVVALSQRFTLPSKWTSWLAVPQAEKENLRRIKKQARFQSVARSLASEIILGREQGRAARRLRQELVGLQRQGVQSASRQNLDDSIHAAMTRIAEDLATEWVEERLSVQPDRTRLKSIRAQLERATRVANQRRSTWKMQPDEMIAQQQRWVGGNKLAELATALVRERHLEAPDVTRMATLQKEITRLERVTQRSAESDIKSQEYFWTRAEMHQLAWGIAREQAMPQPDKEKIAALHNKLEQLTRAAGTEHQRFIDLARINIAGRLQAEVAAAINNAKAQERFAEVNRLEKRQAQLEQHFTDVRGRYGDPLISIEAPEDAEQIIALMPGGEVKKLVLNPDSKKWEARFDIPTYAAEGEYSIIVVIVRKDGTRQTLTLRYHVDITAPQGTGQAQVVSADTPNLRLEVDGDKDTARVLALLPWGEKVDLKPSTVQEQRFFALVPVPSTHRGQESTVTYILTDKAHNRTTVTVDVSK